MSTIKDIFIMCDGCFNETGASCSVKESRQIAISKGYRTVTLENGGRVDYCPECLIKYKVAIKI